MLNNIRHYNTDIQNWGEVGNIKLKGRKPFPNTMGLDEIIAIATKHRAAIIIKTTWQSVRKPGGWYIKGMTHTTNANVWVQTNGTSITYDEIKNVCERNEANHKWSCRDCYLLKYD